MKSAVEWLAEQLYPAIKLNSKYIDELVEQGNKMFEQQIIDAHDMGYIDGGNHKKVTAEMYYNETYGSKGSDEHIVDTNDIKKLIKQAHFDGQYLHSNLSKLLTKEMLDDNAEYYSNEFIRSLKT